MDLAIKWFEVKAGQDWVRDFDYQWSRDDKDPAVVKASRSHRVVRIEHENQIYYAKRYRVKKQRRLVSTLFGSKAQREWQILNKCEGSGIRVSKPVAYGRNFGLMNKAGYLVIANVDGEPVQFIAEREEVDSDLLLDLLKRIGIHTRGLHELNFFHSDYKMLHIMQLYNENEFELIDLDGAKFLKWFPAERKAHNLMQVYRSLKKPQRTAAVKSALLGGYQQSGEDAAVVDQFEKKISQLTR